MINIKTLKFSNMFSYGEGVQIDFDSRVTQLVGKNGSGKSSIPAILEDLFFNKTTRGIKKKSIKNRNVEANWYSSESEFEINEDQYVISKKVTSKTDLKLIKNGTEDISGHTPTQTYEKVKQLLGMDFTTFTKLVYQSMLSNLDFLLATDANRKKFLVSFFGLESYTELADIIKKELAEVNTAIKSSEASIKALESQMPDAIPAQKLEKEPEPDISKIESLEESLEGLVKSNSEAESLNRAIDTNNSAINRLNQIPDVKTPSSPNIRYDANARREGLTRELAIKESELRTLKTPATKCPTCGTPYNNEDHAKHIEEKKEELSNSIVQIKQELEKVVADCAIITQYETELSKKEQTEELKSELEKNIDRTLPTEKQSIKPTDSIKSEIKALKSELDRVRKYNATVDAENAKIDALHQQYDRLSNSIEKEKTKVQVLSGKKERLDILNEAFGTKGLIAYKIESMTKTFETVLNEYLSIFTDGRFNLVFQIEDTKLALKLLDNGEEIEMASLSSGEFNKVNTSTLLAIRKMMVAVSKINVNLLFLDEVVSVLDEESKDTLIEVLLNEKDLNSVVVSHGYNHPLTKAVKIRKTNDISEVIDGE
jgi:DNA repair exonuclease SbcCD ATPase subunit